MTFLKSCGCCTGAGGCRPCLNCIPSCLEVTLAGFSHSTENCNECAFLDDTKFIVKRPQGLASCPSVSLSILDPTGSGAQLTPTYGLNANGSCKLSAISVTTPCLAKSSDPPFNCTAYGNPLSGSGYTSPVLKTSTSGAECRRPVVSFSTDNNGKITGVSVQDGGEYWPAGSCTYVSDRVCAVCPQPNGVRELYATLSIGPQANTVQIIRREWYDYGGGPRFADAVQVTGTQGTIGENGSFISCDGFEIESKNITGCAENGSITIAAVECAQESVGYCKNKGEMPDSITLSLTGMGRLFLWTSLGGAYDPVYGFCEDEDAEGIFCGECSEPEAFLRTGGSPGGAAGYDGSLIIQDCDVVCDLVPSNGCGWTYQGLAPSSASGYGRNTDVPRTVDCGGELSVPAEVTISPTALSTTVSIAPPSFGAETALAEATVSGGAVDEIAVTYGGSGYAREIIDRVQPTVTASSQSTNGTNATFSVALTSNGAEEPSWYVSSVSVVNGGTGYVGNESLSFSVATGDTVEWNAWGYIIVGRTVPTLSASAPNGSGAVLSVSLSQTIDWQTGAAAWEVASVSVAGGGTGYTDGDSVTFTVDDGIEIQWSGASATITTAREEPEVTASVAWSSGSGASLDVNLQPSGSNAWSISGVTIAEGGSGYSQYDQIEFATDDSQSGWSYGYVSSVDQDGAITGITLYYSASYWRSTGVIESVNVSYGGLYYKSTGSVESVRLEEGGQYVRFQPTGQVEADTPAVTISSNTGRGATAEAEVDQDLDSDTFGQVTSVTVTNSGEEYYLSSAGWIVSVAIANLGHRQILLSEPVPPENPNPNPEHCDNFTDKWELIYGRVSTKACPTDLLRKSFKMAMGLRDPYYTRGAWPEGFADYCVTPGNGYSTADGLTIFGFSDDITCELSAG